MQVPRAEARDIDRWKLMHFSRFPILTDPDTETTHPSHFSIPEALEYTNSLDPKPERAFIVGFCHSADHYVEDERMRALDGEKNGTTIRIAYDGQKITI